MRTVAAISAMAWEVFAGPRWGSDDELFGFRVIGDIGKSKRTGLKDAVANFAVDAGRELTGLADRCNSISATASE